MLPSSQDFIYSIIKSKKVYALKNEEGYALSLSNFFVNDDDELIEMFCFWSDKEKAANHIKDEWIDYKVDEIKLSVFLEDWCIAMSDQNYVAGLDLAIDMSGDEVDSLELLIEICKVLVREKIELEFVKFKGINQIMHEAKQAIKYE